MLAEPVKIAAVQMVSTPVVEENFANARRLVADAARQGARLVLLQNPQEAKQKIRLEKRLPASSRIMESPALGTIVEQILMIERADRSAALPASDAARSGNAV